MAERLAAEIMDAINSTGGAFKKKGRNASYGRGKQSFGHITVGNYVLYTF